MRISCSINSNQVTQLYGALAHSSDNQMNKYYVYQTPPLPTIYEFILIIPWEESIEHIKRKLHDQHIPI